MDYSIDRKSGHGDDELENMSMKTTILYGFGGCSISYIYHGIVEYSIEGHYRFSTSFIIFHRMQCPLFIIPYIMHVIIFITACHLQLHNCYHSKLCYRFTMAIIQYLLQLSYIYSSCL